jgi:hypothetical protein
MAALGFNEHRYSSMKKDLLLYVGSGLLVGSAVLGGALGLAATLRAKIQGFRYGVFYSVFALVASMGYCLASIAFFFSFLGPELQLPMFCSLIAIGFLAGLVVMAVYVRKDSRVLFGILSLYSILVFWLAPLFIWNVIYLVFVARRSPRQPDLALQRTPGPVPVSESHVSGPAPLS